MRPAACPISITEDWGGSAQLEYSSSWDGGFGTRGNSSHILTYTTKIMPVNGYVIAVKNTSTYGGENWVDWELKYTNDKGNRLGNVAWTSQLKISETLFVLDKILMVMAILDFQLNH